MDSHSAEQVTAFVVRQYRGVCFVQDLENCSYHCSTNYSDFQLSHWSSGTRYILEVSHLHYNLNRYVDATVIPKVQI